MTTLQALSCKDHDVQAVITDEISSIAAAMSENFKWQLATVMLPTEFLPFFLFCHVDRLDHTLTSSCIPQAFYARQIMHEYE